MVKKLVLKDKVSEYQEVESAEEALRLFMDDDKVLGRMGVDGLYILVFNGVDVSTQWMFIDTLVCFVPMSKETILGQLKSYMNRGELLIFDDIVEAKNYKGA